MAFNKWKIGLDIQEDGARALAVSQGRGGWSLCRWWWFPTLDAYSEDIPESLTGWYRLLPRGSQLRVALSGSRTLQRTIASETGVLNERQRGMYLTGTMGQQLKMAANELSLDYFQRGSGNYAVTAARRQDVDALYVKLRQIKLHPVAIIPDACVLSCFFPFIHDKTRTLLVYRARENWLWASPDEWGVVPVVNTPTLAALCQTLSIAPEQVALCGSETVHKHVFNFDPLSVFTRLQPPLPDDNARYAIALGLAMAVVETGAW